MEPVVTAELPQEETVIHSRLLKCALEVEESRAYFSHVTPGTLPSAQQAFDEYWFGSKSLPRVEVLLANLRARFAAFPAALSVLHGWREMSPTIRKLVCHWHLQLSDPLYRAFTGQFLVQRRVDGRHEVTRDGVVKWVGEQGPERWTMATRIQFASKLLSSAFAAGLVGSSRDPRPLVFPTVSDDALTYLLYLLRETQFEGTLLVNPYVASVGLSPSTLEGRLRALPALAFERQGDLVQYGWRYATLVDWATARLGLIEEGDVP
jgi:hypothetical protein